jgi:predicted enzyme related to lactoylglutathione lyase
VTISVWNPTQMGMEHKTSPNAIALHVDDVHEARAALEKRGVEFEGDTFDTGVCHMAFFTDPDGNALMLHSRYAPRNTES